ncbi:MAG TPA: MlaD family protein [Burkholderiaceae bacterium]|nr:MlaD family protein [Burkholderiaceae bacterium]
MEPETRYTLIGAAMLALIAAAVGAYLWLASAGPATDFRYYLIVFERQSVEGLQIGGDVNMRGLKIGRVESYRISRDNINQVRVLIRVDRRTPISTNTQAVVARNFVTGIARINLDTPGTPGPELVEAPPGERFPVIAEGTSNIDQITDAINEMALAGSATLRNLNEVLSPHNRAAFTEALAAIRDLTAGLNDRLARIDGTAARFEGTAVALQQAGRDFSALAQQLAGQTEPLSQEAIATLREARGTLRELSRTARSLEQTVGRAARTFETESAGLARRFESTADIGLNELRATTHDLRAGLESLARALDRLADPRAAILGPGQQQLGPGERLR